MQLLRTQFTESGFVFKQLDRDVDFALYEKRRLKYTAITYEVIRIRHRPAEKVFDVQYPLREVYPANETWGTDGWSFTELSDAQRRYASLTLPADSRPLETPPVAPANTTNTTQTPHGN